MNGGYVHEHVLLGNLEAAFRQYGVIARRQVLCGVGARKGYADMTVDLPDGRLLAIEAECSHRRVANDYQKAHDLRVDLLWIVVPNHRVLAAVRREARRSGINSHEVPASLLTLGQPLPHHDNRGDLLPTGCPIRR